MSVTGYPNKVEQVIKDLVDIHDNYDRLITKVGRTKWRPSEKAATVVSYQYKQASVAVAIDLLRATKRHPNECGCTLCGSEADKILTSAAKEVTR
jgi:hypothetical protein